MTLVLPVGFPSSPSSVTFGGCNAGDMCLPVSPCSTVCLSARQSTSAYLAARPTSAAFGVGVSGKSSMIFRSGGDLCLPASPSSVVFGALRLLDGHSTTTSRGPHLPASPCSCNAEVPDEIQQETGKTNQGFAPARSTSPSTGSGSSSDSGPRLLASSGSGSGDDSDSSDLLCVPPPPIAPESFPLRPVASRRRRRTAQASSFRAEEIFSGKGEKELFQPRANTVQEPCISSLLSTPRTNQTCCACLCDIKASKLESFCGVHTCCTDCAATSASLQVQSGCMPRCFHPDCRALIDPLVAMRLLKPKDYELYLRLALWSNPCIEACPQCCELVYSDPTKNENAKVQCPSCFHGFCRDCRCPVHEGLDCASALQKQEGLMALEREAHEPELESMVSSRTPAQSMKSPWGKVHSEHCWKTCPRCRATVEKMDDEDCDHMTCACCRHEFCWSCLADRAVIYAHGNHHHWSTCKFHTSYAGRDEYLPDRCNKCLLRGTACRASGGEGTSHKLLNFAAGSFGERPAAVLDACMRWVQGALDTTSCSTVKREHCCTIHRI